jgi:hypothetical protein
MLLHQKVLSFLILYLTSNTEMIAVLRNVPEVASEKPNKFYRPVSWQNSNWQELEHDTGIINMTVSNAFCYLS